MTSRDSSGSSDPLVCLTALAPGDRMVVAQLGQSLDGRIATPTGASRYINRSGALDHLHKVRAHVDAVVVGIGTVLADDPLLNVRRVPGAHPVRVVIDPSGRMPAGARCLTDDGVHRIVVRTPETAALPLPPGVEVVVLARENGSIPPQAIVDALGERGMARLLVEGGAATISAFLAAGALDRLHVLVAPMLIGSGKNGLDLPPIDGLDEALRPVTQVHILPDGDVLFDCDLRRAWSHDE